MATRYDEGNDAMDSEARDDRRRMHYIIAALGVMLLGCIGLGIYAYADPDRPETFNFIALLIIFMTALAASSIIFVSLRMGSDQEAFGLPSGSVRALLAVGIMILFVVFGLPVVSSEPKELSSGRIRVPAEQVDRLIELNSQQGFVVRVRDPGVAATVPATPGAAPPRLASLEIVRMNAVTDDQMDLNKQMLTAIVTLLTTVIGFYFGSRSTTDGLKVAPDGNGGGGRENGGGCNGGDEPKAAADEAAEGSGADSEAAGDGGEASPEQLPDGVNR